MIAGTLALLHVWRVILLCAAITHERAHPALALLMLVPLNHLLYNLTASVLPSDYRSTHWTRIPLAAGRIRSHHRISAVPASSSLYTCSPRSWWSGGMIPSGR